MTKRELVNLVLSRVNGGSFTTDIFKGLHPKIVDNYIELAINYAMFQIFKKNDSNYETYCEWITDVDVKPFIMSLYKSEYPSALVQSTFKTNSIRKIVPTEDYLTDVFIPSTQIEATMSERLGTLSRQGLIAYVTQKDGIIFYNHNKNIEKVNVLAFKAASSYNWDEELPIPSGTEDVVLQFIFKYTERNPIKNHQDDNPDT